MYATFTCYLKLRVIREVALCGRELTKIANYKVRYPNNTYNLLTIARKDTQSGIDLAQN